MADHTCIHEADFGRIDTNLEVINETLKDQKIAVSAFLKFMTEREILNGIAKEKREWSWICVIVMLSGLIFCFYILKKKKYAT